MRRWWKIGWLIIIRTLSTDCLLIPLRQLPGHSFNKLMMNLTSRHGIRTSFAGNCVLTSWESAGYGASTTSYSLSKFKVITIAWPGLTSTSCPIKRLGASSFSVRGRKSFSEVTDSELNNLTIRTVQISYFNFQKSFFGILVFIEVKIQKINSLFNF